MHTKYYCGGTTTGRPHTITACRWMLNADGSVRASLNAANSSAGAVGCPRGWTPCWRSCCVGTAPGGGAAAGSAPMSPPDAEDSPPSADRPSSSRTLSRRWATAEIHRGSGCDPFGRHTCLSFAGILPGKEPVRPDT